MKKSNKRLKMLVGGLVSSLMALAMAFTSAGTPNTQHIQANSTLPSGYVSQYMLEVYAPWPATAEISHQSGGDRLDLRYRPDDDGSGVDVSDCTGLEIYVDGQSQSFTESYDGWNCNASITLQDSSGSAMSLYLDSGAPEMSGSGTVNHSNSWTSWDMSFGWYTMNFTAQVSDDADGDGIADADDLCPNTWDSSNGDSDNDGIGDVCDDYYNGVDHAGNAFPDDSCGWEAYDSSDGSYTVVMDEPGFTIYYDWGYDVYDNCTWSDTVYYDSGSGGSSGGSYGGCVDFSHADYPDLSCSECSDSDGSITSWSCWSNDTTSGVWTTEEFEKDGYDWCSRSYDDGVLQSESCTSYTSMGDGTRIYDSEVMEGVLMYCEYSDWGYSCWGESEDERSFTDGDLECEEEYDSNGNVRNVWCSEDMGETDDEWKTRYEEGPTTCEEHNEARASDPNGGDWCMVCTTGDGELLEDYDTCAFALDGDNDDEDEDEDEDDRDEEDEDDHDEEDDDDRDEEDEDDDDRDEEEYEEECWEKEPGCWECWAGPEFIDYFCEDGSHEDDDDQDSDGGELEDELGWLEVDLRGFERLVKRIERVGDDHEEMKDWFEEDLDWREEEDLAPELLSDLIDEVEDAIEELEDLADEADEVQEEFEEVFEAMEDVIEDADSDDSDAYWLFLKKGDRYRLYRDIFDGYTNIYEVGQHYMELQNESSRMIARIEQLGEDVPGDFEDELEDALDDFEDAKADYLATAAEAEAYIAGLTDYSLSDILDDADYRSQLWDESEELWEVWDDLNRDREMIWVVSEDTMFLWDAMHELYEMEGDIRSHDWILEEVQFIREDIATILDAILVVSNHVTDPVVLSKLGEVNDVAVRAELMLSNIEDEIESGNADGDKMEELWDKMDQLGDYVEPRMEAVADHIEENWASWSLSDADREMIEFFLYMETGHHGDPEYIPGETPGEGPDDCRRCDRLEETYDPETADQLKDLVQEDLVDELVQEITNSVMEAVMQHVEEDLADEILVSVMNNIDKFKHERFGDNFANELLENNNRVYEEMAAVEINANSAGLSVQAPMENLEALHMAFANMPMPDEDLATEVASFWDDAEAVVSANPTRSEVEDLVETGQALLADAEEAKYENKLGMKDVPGYFDADFDGTWYAEPVMEGLGVYWDGNSDINGHPTYEFAPGNATNRAEALKMVLSAFGYSEMAGATADQWWLGWQETARSAGLSIANEDPTQTISRGEVFQMIYELSGMDAPSTVSGVFPDVSIYDAHANPAVALYNAGIVNGDGDTGNARLYDGLNRAEMAALVTRAATYVEEQEFLNTGLTVLRTLPKKETSSFIQKMLPANLFQTW